MDIRQLKHFVGVATHGNFTRAAGDLNISQPALTRSVRLLEDSLGVALFVRTPQGVELTQHGDTFFRHAKLIINSIHTAQKEIHATKDGGWAEVRVGIASMFSNFLVPEAITKATLDNPNFSASVKVGLFEDMARHLSEGKIDLIVTTRDDTSDHREINFEALCDVSSVLVVGSTNPLAQQAEVELVDLVKENWVVLNHPLMESFLSVFFAQSGLSAPASKVRTSSLNMLRSMIRHQQFIGFLPSHWIKEELDTGILNIIDVAGMPLKGTAGIATRRSALLNKNAKLLIEELKTAALSLTGTNDQTDRLSDC